MRVRLRGTCFMAPSSEPQAASAKPPSKPKATSFVFCENFLILSSTSKRPYYMRNALYDLHGANVALAEAEVKGGSLADSPLQGRP